MIVGWDDNIPKEKFFYSENTEAGYENASAKITSINGGWLCRNSWGIDNAPFIDDGYFYISYDETSITETMYTVEAINADTYKYNYHYDTTGYSGSVGDDSITAYGNVYKVSGEDDNQVLEAVNIAVDASNAVYDVKVYVKNSAMDHFEDGELKSQKRCSNDTAGIYTFELDNKVKLQKGEYYSIVVYPISCDGSFKLFVDGHSKYDEIFPGFQWYKTVNEVEEGQSFYKEGETYVDLYEDSVLKNGKQIGYTIRIKGLANESHGIKSVKALNKPNKLIYNYGDKIDLTGLKVQIEYTDGETEDVVYSEENKNDFNITTTLTSITDVVKDLKYIKLTYNSKIVTFDEIEKINGGELNNNEFLPIEVNNIPNFTEPLLISGSSQRSTSQWDMTETYAYNLSKNKTFMFSYKTNPSDEYNYDDTIAGYYLGIGDNNTMVGYDTITDVVLPEGNIKGFPDVTGYNDVISNESMSFYFRNNYIVVDITRRDDVVFFIPRFSGLCKDISINKTANKINYFSDEKFDPTGLIIDANHYGYKGNPMNPANPNNLQIKSFEYNDKYKNEFIFEPSLDTPLAAGTTEINVTFRGKTISIPIEVFNKNAPKINVVFDHKDGNDTKTTIQIAQGSKVLPIANPTKDNYVFEYWYDTINGNPNNPFDFNTNLYNDTYLEASWSGRICRVRVDISKDLKDNPQHGEDYLIYNFHYGTSLPILPKSTVWGKRHKGQRILSKQGIIGPNSSKIPPGIRP